MPDTATAARLAVLEVMGWPDDRGQPAEPAVPAEAHWSLAGELVDAIAPIITAHTRRHVADEIADCIARKGCGKPTHDTAACLVCLTHGLDADHARDHGKGRP